jgi:hypothetical protein
MCSADNPSEIAGTTLPRTGWLRDLYFRWLAADETHLPGRRDFLPEDIGPSISKIAILEYLDQCDDFNLRLTGSDLTAIALLPARSAPLAQCLDGQAAASLRSVLKQPLLTGKPAVLNGNSPEYDEMAEILLLPLASRTGGYFDQIMLAAQPGRHASLLDGPTVCLF